VRVVGLMSGTSLDGIDAALVEIGHGEPGVDWRLVEFRTSPYTRDQRAAIQRVLAGGSLAELTRLHGSLGEWLAAAALELCRAAGVAPSTVDLIGSHGQTIWHEPPDAAGRGATLQLGCAATIAERTGIPVVSDFRSRDMAAGGEGAPLVPWADRLLYSQDTPRILQNIGGMANLTYLPPLDSSDDVVAFDTGPGNALIDAATELATDGAHSYDEDGRWAREGAVNEMLLAELLTHPFYQRPPPKSTGRETFGLPYVRALAERSPPGTTQDWADLIATLTALTARTVADGIKRWADPGPEGEIIVTGGGARNPALMELLQRELEPRLVGTGEGTGFRGDAREAVAFAALAWAHVQGLSGNVPGATGASGPRVLGSLTPGR
jgi:anhydro-N-acetylmuramic acid kinase